MQITNPSFASGNSALMGLGANPVEAAYTYTESDGTTMVVMTDNSVYQLDESTGTLTLNRDLTAVLRQVDASAPGIVQEQGGSSFDFDSLLTKLLTVIPVVVTANAQRQLLQTNIERAKQGLPPLNAAAYMPGVNVGLTGDTKTMVYVLAAGLGAVVLLSMAGGKRKGN